MGFSTVPCNEFVEVLGSKAPVPGGGGASALVGAVGTALGNMVGALTVGKKKYADVEEEMKELMAKATTLQDELLHLIERDAEVFEPLSKAYGMPRETEEEKAEKARVMEIVLKDACSVPMEIMEKCCEAIDLIVEFAAKGSALVGAVGTALGNMVGALTVGKKKYADVEEEMKELMAKATTLQDELLHLIERDAEVFEPLSKAYGMPRETEEEKAEKARVMEIVLKDACSVPMEIMEKCCEAIDLIVEFAAKGSALAISDAGVGATFCKAALEGASLNVYINTKSMKNREYAEELNRKCDEMLAVYTVKADEIFRNVLGRLKA